MGPECLAASQCGELFQELRTLEEPDSINANIRLHDEIFHLSFGVSAVVVSSVGEDEQHSSRVLGRFHPVHAQIYGIMQRGPALGMDERKALENLPGIRSKAGLHRRLVTEPNEEELITRHGCRKKLFEYS